MRRSIPELRWLYSVPNGGARSATTAALMRAEGVRRGVPDLVLPVARGGHFGLYVEMKRPGRHSTTREQREWIAGLIEQGYRAVVCVGWDAAREEIVRYLDQPRTVAATPPAA
jgi:hypothetical protein